MSLISKLRNSNGQFDIDDYIDNENVYLRAIKTLLKKEDYRLLCKVLDCYYVGYRSYSDHPLISYRPGSDFVISYYPLFLYAQLLEQGVKGVLRRNKEKSMFCYLQLLKRIEKVPHYISSYLYKNNKIDILLKCAYPDLMDRYPVALYHAGIHYLRLKDYEMAFSLFKKGADFSDNGRQIVYPYYLLGRNQSMVADMYLKGLGVEKNERKAIEYYKKSASNCGKREHRKMGDIYLKRGDYASAFFAYTEINENWPWIYSLSFMHPSGLKRKFEIIYDNLNKKYMKTDDEIIVLVMMLKIGLGCDRDSERADELLDDRPEWIDQWIDNYCSVDMY